MAGRVEARRAFGPAGALIAVAVLAAAYAGARSSADHSAVPMPAPSGPLTAKQTAISPDGSRIAFVVRAGVEGFLLIMNADGSEQRVLSRRSLGFGAVSFTTAADRVLFLGHDDNGHDVLRSVRVDGSEDTVLGPLPDAVPAFSPDGKQVAFRYASTGLSDDGDLYLANVDGSDRRVLAPAPGDDELPAFSPDGQRIAFRSTRGGGGVFEVWVVGLDGNAPRRLAVDDEVTSLGFTPDGREVICRVSGAVSHRSPYLVGTDAQGLRRPFAEDMSHVVLTPDGHHAVFTGASGSNVEVWQADLDTGERRQLSHLDDAFRAAR